MKRFLERYARWSARRPWPVLGATAAVFAVGLLLGLHLTVTADLGVLLPQGAPSVRHLDLAAQRLGSTDAMYVSVESPDADANHRFLDDVAAVLTLWPEQPLVFYRPDIRYFKDRRLLYADYEDMQTVRDNLAARIRWEKVHSNPAYIDLTGDPAPEIIPPEIREKYENRYRSALGDTLDRTTDTDVAAAGAGDYMYLETSREARRPDGTTRKTWITTMMVRFPGEAVAMDFTENIVYRAECLIGTRDLSDCLDPDRWPGLDEPPPCARTVLRAASYHPDLIAEVGGGFRHRVAEANALLKDVRASALGAVAGMTLIVLAAFRRFRALLYVLLPLLFGIVMCLGIAYLVLDQLNLVTAFTFAVLLGLGIDFGIHLGKRYEEERAAGLGNEDAIARAFRQTGSSMLAAMLTTVLAFGMLVSARFRGFSEFGQLTVIGVPLSMCAAFALFPVVVTLAERVRPMRPRPLGEPAADRVRLSPNVGRVVLVGALLTTAAAFSLAPFLGFEYDYGKLGTKRPVDSKIDTREATRGYTGSPAVAMARSSEQARVAHRYLQRRMRTGEGLLREALSLHSFVPKKQIQKIRILREMDRMMDDPSFGFYEDRLTDEDLDRLAEWREYLRIGPVEPLAPDFPEWARKLFEDRLVPHETALRARWEADRRAGALDRLATEYPPWARELFSEMDASHLDASDRTVGRVVYLMPDVNMSNGIDAQRLQQAYQVIRLPDKTDVPVASSGFVFADIVRYIRADGRLATSLALATVFIVLFIQYRSLKRTFVVMVPLIIGFGWLFGILVILEINITFYSMVMLPVLLGIGIDGAIHLHRRYLELGPGSIVTVLRRTGPPVFLSTLTTGVGFGSLMLTRHRGLYSMGELAVVGMATILVATFIVLPALVVAFERPRPEAAAQGGDSTARS